MNPFEATPSAFATNPMGMAQILLFIGLTEGYTFPEGASAARSTKREFCQNFRQDVRGTRPRHATHGSLKTRPRHVAHSVSKAARRFFVSQARGPAT